MAKHRKPNQSDTALRGPSEIEVRVRERAYEIYVSNGRRDGFDLDDWLTAEREVLQRTAIASESATLSTAAA